jgi:CHAT domain-containing protein
VFAVTREGIQQLHQGSTRNVDIRRPVMKIMQIMKEMTGYHGEEEQARKKQINILSRSISAELLDPFTETIKSKTHIIFSVSDPLTAFPFSVLQFNNEPLIKHAAISQAPSLTILHYLSQRKAPQGTPKVSVFAKSPTKESSNTIRSNKEANLHMAGIEAINIARLFSTWPIEASHLTRQAFRKHVEGDSLILHIGTHGDINHRNPLLSSISIGQGQDFRVLDMSSIHSKVSLLVFAACLSGLGKATTGNEVLGFSHVVLSTGCQAYIGTLWKVSDFGSMLIMTLFYRLLKDEVHLSVAEVLRRAQLELIGLDSEKVGLLLDGMLENWTAPGDQDRSPAEFVPDAQFLLLTTKMILGQLDWTSPFYWAPFTLMGYGDFRFLPAST